MKQRRPHEAENIEIEMTPMIDVTFLLLVFFLCTIQFKTLEGKLQAYLPKDVGGGTSLEEPKEKVEIRIQVLRAGERRDPGNRTKAWNGEGRFEYVGRELTYFVGPRELRDLDRLSAMLAKLYRADPERPTTIEPLPGTVYGDVVPVLDRALEAGFREISFAGE